MTILWQGVPGYKVWRLGEHFREPGASMPSQAIDHVWDDAGDHLGHVSHPNHACKIQINGEDCTEVAQVIVAALNAADVGQPVLPERLVARRAQAAAMASEGA